MKVFRKEGPWTVQVYWPQIRISKYELYFSCRTVARLVFKDKHFAIGIELFGFGFGIMK